MIDDEAFEASQPLDPAQRCGRYRGELENVQVREPAEKAEIRAARAIQSQDPQSAQRRDRRLVPTPAVADPKPFEPRKFGEALQRLGRRGPRPTTRAMDGSASFSSVQLLF